MISCAQPKQTPQSVLVWAVLLVAGICFQPDTAWAEAGIVLDAPSFEREHNTIIIPFQGGIPKATVQSFDGGTRLEIEFIGTQTGSGKPYKLGVFHPLVTKVEMAPVSNQARVKVRVSLANPATVSIVPDPRQGVLQLRLTKEIVSAPRVAREFLPAVPPPEGPLLPGEVPSPNHSALVSSERPRPQPLHGIRLDETPEYGRVPYAGPRSGPVRLGGTAPLPGTPASGDYVYRKSIPGDTAHDITEIQVRTPRRSSVDITPGSLSGVAVNLSPPENLRPALEAPVSPIRQEGWVNPLPNEPWKRPVYRGNTIFRTARAVALRSGYALLSERAESFGSNLEGAGSTALGFVGHVPLGPSWNLALAAESVAYSISSTQIPDAITRRDEYVGNIAFEFLPVRSPWVMAGSVGYSLRYVSQQNNLLPPTEPSAIFTPSILFHGPTLGGRAWAPVWGDWGIVAEGALMPYAFRGEDAFTTAIGNVWGYQALGGLKWAGGAVALTAQLRTQGNRSYTGSYSFVRWGPEVIATWRF